MFISKLYIYFAPMNNELKNINLFDLKKHWSNRLGKLQTKNQQNERMEIGLGHFDISFRLTQLAIKFKL